MVSLHIIESPLLGPGFSHLQTPLRGFFCGGVNPSNDPLYYVNAVQSLLRLYQSKAASLPLVINTDGWIKSMGHDLLCSVIQEAQPDHIVQLLATTKNKQFDLPSNGKWMIHALNPWDPNYTSQPNRSSQEMRLYRYHAYFLSGTSCEINRQQLQNLHLTSEKNRLNSYIHQAYTKLKPFTLHFDQVDIAFAGSSVPSCQLLVSLNACLVGLCINPRKKSPPTSQGLRILSQIPHGPCLGVGFIRGIDPNRKLLYLLSPLEEEKISLINLIVRSAPNLKSVATLLLDTEENVQTPYVVDHLLPPEGTGAGEMKSRNSIKRRRDENNYNTPTK
jgi:polynucleotide 5'-hydroxyl-kinase GRC3/NOL9